MPGPFGLDTPQDAEARRQQRTAQQRFAFSRSYQAGSPGASAGQALANIFGGSVRKFLDTRTARKSEEVRLAEQGLSKQEARELAKKNITPDFAEVRQAKRMQAAGAEGRELVEYLTPQVGSALAQASGMMLTASKLRKLGFGAQATEMTLNAGAIRNQEQARLLGVEKVKADLDKTRAETGQKYASTILAGRRAENVGKGESQNLSEEIERLTAENDVSDDPKQIESNERLIGSHRGRLDVLQREQVGRTEFDAPNPLSAAGKNTQATDIVDSTVLVGQLGEVEAMLLNTEGDLATGFWGSIGEGTLGFMEYVFNRRLSESEKDFVKRVNEHHGAPALLAANIRHSLTGAAMSPAEAVFLEPFLPTPGDNRAKMLNKVRVISRYTTLDRDIRQALLDDPYTGEKYMASLAAEIRGVKPPTRETGTNTDQVNKAVQAALDASAAISGGS